jgi:hypothetical protein
LDVKACHRLRGGDQLDDRAAGDQGRPCQFIVYEAVRAALDLYLHLQ